MTIRTTPKYKLLAFSLLIAYATKHNIPPIQSKSANGVVASFNNFRDQCVPSFSVSLLGPYNSNSFLAFSSLNPVSRLVWYLLQNYSKPILWSSIVLNFSAAIMAWLNVSGVSFSIFFRLSFRKFWKSTNLFLSALSCMFCLASVNAIISWLDVRLMSIETFSKYSNDISKEYDRLIVDQINSVYGMFS